MIHIYKKELNFYFKGMFGYFFGAVLLMFAGIYTVIVNFNMGYANFEYTLNNIAFLYLIIIPILTMRSVSEERKQKTDQLLYSLPISAVKIIIGKYLAMLTVLAIPVAIVCFYPLSYIRYGELSFAMTYGCVLGFFMLGASLIAVGLFISTLTENQAIAAGISFAVFLIMYFGKNLTDYLPGTAVASLAALIAAAAVISLILFFLTKNIYAAGILLCAGVCISELLYMNSKRSFEGLFARIVGSLSVFERFYSFVRGVFDIRSLVFFVSVIIMFLYLSVQALEKRRWS